LNTLKVYENCRNDDFLRNAFFDFTEKVFPGINFRVWYSRGFWLKRYIPFAIVRDDKIISNVSITEMKILVDGRPMNGLQFGTVGTIPEYRNQGLSRYLMEYVLDKYLNRVDIMFLFANESVLDFYPKFGFSPHSESVFISRSEIPRPAYCARKLDIQNEADMVLIRDRLETRTVLTDIFGAADYDFITLWHVLNIFPNNLYYLEEEDVIFLITEGAEKLHVWDVIYRKPFDITAAISKVIKGAGLKSILYYFTPEKLGIKHYDAEIFAESPLFVRGDFPIGGRPFKFPTTAQT